MCLWCVGGLLSVCVTLCFFVCECHCVVFVLWCVCVVCALCVSLCLCVCVCVCARARMRVCIVKWQALSVCKQISTSVCTEQTDVISLQNITVTFRLCCKDLMQGIINRSPCLLVEN